MIKHTYTAYAVLIFFAISFDVFSQTSPAKNFIENKGQVADMSGNARPDILFSADAGAMGLFLRKDGFYYVLKEEDHSSKGDVVEKDPGMPEMPDYNMMRLDLDFVGCNSEVKIIKDKQGQGYNNYYRSNCPQGILGVNTFGKIQYENLYDNIDMSCFVKSDGSTGPRTRGGFEYDFIVKPGGDPSLIKLKYKGVNEISINEKRLKIKTAVGDMGEYIPKVYQEVDGKIVDIEAEYILDETTVSFRIKKYDHAFPLVIDPWISYYGLSNTWGMSIATDNTGGFAVAGFVGISGEVLPDGDPGLVFRNTKSSMTTDAYVGRFDANHNHLWSAYIGSTTGNGLSEGGYGVKINSSGDIIVVGATCASGFPVSTTCIQSTLSGAEDGFVFSLNSAGGRNWATYFGGTLYDAITGVAADAAGKVYISGLTSSTAGLPLQSAWRNTNAGSVDAFMACLDNNNNGSLVWSTYYGGSAFDGAAGVAYDNNTNQVVFVGASSSTNLPLTGTSFQGTNAGSTDAFVVKFNAAGGAPLWGTYYGGSSTEASPGTFAAITYVAAFDSEGGMGIDVDNQSNIVIGGHTYSTSLPMTTGSFQNTNLAAPASNAFVAKFNSSGSCLWGTFYGGSAGSYMGYPIGTGFAGISVDQNNNHIYIMGDTYSPDLPTTSCAFETFYHSATVRGTEGMYFANFDPGGSLKCSSYFTDVVGYGHDESFGASQMANFGGNMYITGMAGGPGFPVTPDAYQTDFSYGGLGNTVIGIVCANTCNDNPVVADLSVNKTNLCKGDLVNFTDLSTTCDVSQMQWSWTFPGATPSSSTAQHPIGIQYNIAGTYNVGLTVTTPCGTGAVTKNVYIDVRDLNVALQNKTDVSCHGNGDGAATVNAGSGFPNYTYTWSTNPAQNSSTASNLSAGTYSCIVTDVNGCTASTSAIIAEPAILFGLITSQTDVTCYGYNNGSLTAGALGGTPAYSYAWSSAAAGATSSGLIAGVYTVTITDSHQCIFTRTVQVTQPPLLTASVSSTAVLCNTGTNGSATVIAGGGTPGYTYNWLPGGSLAATATGLGAGTYTIVVSDNYGCTTNSSVSVTEPNAINLQLYSSSALCNGSATGTASVTVNGGTGPYAYSWSNSQNTTQATNLVAGTYSVTITDNNNCVSKNTIAVTEPAAILLQVSTTVANCGLSDGSATLTASGGTPGYSYLWNVGQTTGAATGLSPNTYNCVITDANNCSAIVTATVNNASGVAISNIVSTSTSCFGTCDGGATVTVNGGNLPYTYSWNSGGQNTNAATGLCSTVYSVSVTDNSGCIVTGTVSVSQPSTISTTVAAVSPGCYNSSDGSASINVSGGSPGYSYSWNIGQQNVNATGLAAGSYTVVVTDLNNCIYTSTVTITAPSQVVVSSTSNAAVCSGSSVALTANANGGTPGYTYSWSGGQNGASVNVSPLQFTIYTVTATDNNGCTALNTSTVVVNSLPVVAFTADTTSGCAPLCVEFTNTTPGTSIASWNFGNGNSSASITTANNCFNISGNYNVSLTITDVNGCVGTLTKNNYINMFASPVAQFSANPMSTTILNPVIYFTDQSQNAITWTWSFGDVNSSFSTIQHPNYAYSDTGHYAVTLSVTNLQGCSDSITKIVEIKQDHTTYIPNTFTPNGDGTNDLFIPDGIGMDNDKFEMLIFDRWGKKIYETNDINKGWDGKMQDELVQQDTYVYKIFIKRSNGSNSRYVGSVNVIR